MSRGIKRDLNRALEKVQAEIAGATGKYGRGLSAEGYAGGYRDALYDVLAALNGWPSNTSQYWPRPPQKARASR